MKTDYRPYHKYVICKLTDGLDNDEYRIRIKGWLFNRWYRTYSFRGYELSNAIKTFTTEKEAREFLKLEKERYENNIRKNNISIKELDNP